MKFSNVNAAGPAGRKAVLAVLRRNKSRESFKDNGVRVFSECVYPQVEFMLPRVQLPFAREGVAKPAGVSWLVILALVEKLTAALVVAEDLVVEVEADHLGAQPAPDAIAGLGIQLVVRQCPDVARGTRGTKFIGVDTSNQSRGAVVVLEDARSVVGKAYAGGEAILVKGGADSPGIGCLVDQAGLIESQREAEPMQDTLPSQKTPRPKLAEVVRSINSSVLRAVRPNRPRKLRT